MKAIILAAGMGTRMKHHTVNMPKGMVKILDKTLIERQISILRNQKIYDISIVTGYNSEKINFTDVNIYFNKNFYKTNMVESLMCAKKEFDDDKWVWDPEKEEATLLIGWESRAIWKNISQTEINLVQKDFEKIARMETGELSGNPFPLIFEGELNPE